MVVEGYDKAEVPLDNLELFDDAGGAFAQFADGEGDMPKEAPRTGDCTTVAVAMLALMCMGAVAAGRKMRNAKCEKKMRNAKCGMRNYW